jgi:RNA:NAD 2'-phosphotransferase (TPT1/KptA family)
MKHWRYLGIYPNNTDKQSMDIGGWAMIDINISAFMKMFEENGRKLDDNFVKAVVEDSKTKEDKPCEK